MTLSKLRAAVATDSCGNHIFTCIRVVGAESPRHHRVLAIRRDTLVSIIFARRKIIPFGALERVGECPEILLVVVSRHREEAHQINAVLLCKGVVIRDGVVPGIVEITMVSEFNEVVRIVLIECIGFLRHTEAVGREVGSKHRLNLQALNRRNLEVDIAECAPSLFLLLLCFDIAERVHFRGELVFYRTERRVQARLLVAVAISINRLVEGVHQECMRNSVVVGVIITHEREVEVDTRLHVFINSSVNRTLEIDTALLIAYEHALVLVVTYTEVVAYVLRRAVDCDIMILLETLLEHNLSPIGGHTILEERFQTIIIRSSISTNSHLVETASH